MIEENNVITLDINGTETNVLVETIFAVEETSFVSMIPLSQVEKDNPQQIIYIYEEKNDEIYFYEPTDEQFCIAEKALEKIYSE